MNDNPNPDNVATTSSTQSTICLQPPVLDLNVERYAAFRTWKERWEDYVLLSGLGEKDKRIQAAMLRYTFSSDTQKIYTSLSLSSETKEDPALIIDELEKYAKGTINETLERHHFNMRQQEDGEKFDEYLTELKVLATNCNYCVTCYPGILRDRIVAGIRNDQVRQLLLAEKSLDLEGAISKCRSFEVADDGMNSIITQKKTIYTEVDRVRGSNSNTNYSASMRKNDQNSKDCKFCLKKHKWGRKFCPAFGKTCMACKKQNHFAGSEICDKVNDYTVNHDDNVMEVLFLGAVNASGIEEEKDVEVYRVKDNAEVEKITKDFYIRVKVANNEVGFKIDTGADVSVIKLEDLEKFKVNKDSLKKSRRSLNAAGGTKLNCVGYFTKEIVFKDKRTEMMCYVCSNVTQNLLGKPEIRELEILKLNVDSCHSEETEVPEYEKFPGLFRPLGRIKGEEIKIELEMTNKVPYHLSTARRVAIPLLKQVEQKLKQMKELGVIKPVEEPTDWCHPTVLVTKADSDDLRICIDLTKLNECVKREFYQLPSVNETLAKIGGKGKYFSKLDANSGYWQMPLSEESQRLCTFITPFGRYCPTVGPFGLSSMPEIFSKKMDEIILGLEGVVKNMDDFLIFGETVEEHDQNLHKVLQVMEGYGMTLNKKKCVFRKEKVTFLGFHISKDGIYPTEEKLSAIKNFPTPMNIGNLRSFMGLAQQMSKFSSQLAEVSEPLRDLLSSKNAWLWTVEHELAFNKVKKLLSEPPILAIYDVERETKIRTDASRLHGISVILYQLHEGVWKPVDCASRYLSAAEKNYATIELEMLAVSWGMNRMDLYLQGLPRFIVETDHNPLVPILNRKSLIEMSPRILRMRMRTLHFNFSAVYVPGKKLMDADALSRAPTSMPTQTDELAEREVDAYLNVVIRNMPATNDMLQKIRMISGKDPELTQLRKAVENGWPEDINMCHNEIKKYWVHRGEITVVRGLLARQSIFWPGINNQIRMVVKRCDICLKYQKSKSKEPMIIPDLPTRAWQIVGSDLFQYGNHHYVIITDYFSFFPEVYKLNQINADTVIKAIQESFSRHGVPEKLVSDNGSQYSSFKFHKFKKEWGFEHTTSSPHYPQSNRLAESSVKVVKSLLKKCGGDDNKFLKGLLVIRNTPLEGGQSPAQTLFGRQLKDNLPVTPDLLDKRHHVKRPLQVIRSKTKKYYDKNVCKQKEESYSARQRVVIQNERTKEWSSYGTILEEVAPRSYLIKMDKGGELRRNKRCIRKVYCVNWHGLPGKKSTEEISVDIDDFADSDTDTLPYDSDSDTIPYMDEEDSAPPSVENVVTNPNLSKRGRIIKKKIPLDYEQL